ncbi:MAG: RNA polymerase sigma factor SigZ [Anaerolineae bacterium]|nr:RNA polymerase sigma factor SigZ [Anaerolineae bacterium]GIK37204.1 MAG: RNA polymerase sigma factor SigZ [Chloroflexota bacterium]
MNPDIKTIWQEFDPKLRQFIFKRVADDDATEDILQEVYIKIHARIHTLRDDSKLQSWIYQIARNAIIDYYRSRKLAMELPETIALPEEPAENDAASELAPSVKAMINRLPEKYQQALILTEYQGLTQQEMAEQLGISWSGAKSRVQRAKEKLKDMLLDCCHFELDRLGNILSYQPRCGCCSSRQSKGDGPSKCGGKSQVFASFLENSRL